VLWKQLKENGPGWHFEILKVEARGDRATSKRSPLIQGSGTLPPPRGNNMLRLLSQKEVPTKKDCFQVPGWRDGHQFQW